MKYVPQLDGFRALCVIAVFLFHSMFLDFGWAGVQAFFVLSGFLITGVLLEAKTADPAAGPFFKGFYARRVLRIFPVYFGYIGLVVFLAIVGVAGAGFTQALRAHNAEHVPPLLVYLYNFARINAGLGSPFFGHLWTLSIEEQFYLLWPLCAFLLSRRNFIRLCAALVVAGPLLRLVELLVLQQMTGNQDPPAKIVYFLTSSHLDAFAIGALLNFRKELPAVDRIASASGRPAFLCMLLLSAVLMLAAKRAHLAQSLSSLGWPLYMAQFGLPVWGYTALNAVFALAIAKAPNIRLLGSRALQRLGKVSYGFYIFHLPVIWIAARISHINRGAFDLPNLVVGLLAFAVTWLLAELSFRLFESRFLRLKGRFGNASAREVASTGEADPVSEARPEDPARG
jgi:peptidoglycan/LPS O-acetylase OafA/YrhL